MRLGYGVSIPVLAMQLAVLGGAVVVAAPAFSVSPVVSGTRGGTLSATTGSASNTTSYARQWRADGVPISGQTGATLDDSTHTYDGKTIDCAVIASGPGGFAYAVSNALTSPDHAGLAIKTTFTGTNAAKLNTLPSIGTDGSGNPTGFSFEGGGDNADGTGANATTNQDKFAIASNACECTQRTGGSRQNYAKMIKDTGSTDMGVEFGFGSSTLSFLGDVVGRYKDPLNYFYFGTITQVGGNAYIGLNSFIAGVATSNIYTPQFGITGTVTQSTKFRYEFIGTQLRVYYDLAGNGTWVQCWAPTSFQGANSGNVAVATVTVISGGTKGGFGQASGYRLVDNMQIYAIDTSINVTGSSSAVTNLGIEFAITGTYTGSPSSYTIELQKLSGEPIEAAAATASATISGGNFSIRSQPSLAAVANTNSTIRVIVRDNLGRALSFTYAIPDYVAVPPTILGMNETSLGTWDIGPSAGWFDPSDYAKEIRRLGVQPSGAQIPSSETGSGSTVKRGWDNSIYSTNGVGLTSYRMVWDVPVPSTQNGTWQISLGAGVNVTGIIQGGNITGWSYNQGTGIGTFTYTYSGANFLLNLVITTASMPAGGVLPSLKLQSATGIFDPAAITNVANVARAIRYLDIIPANNDELYPDRTSLAHPVRAPSQRYLGNNSRERILAHCNLAGADLYWQVKMFDGDALVADDAAYIAATLPTNKLCWVELSNEFFNAIFKQSNDHKMAGIRRGYAPSGATVGTAVPETVYDTAYPTLLATGQGNPRFTTRAFLNGEKFLYNGFIGWQVYQAIGDQPSGAAFADVTNANFSVVYTNADTDRAGKRWISTRSKEIKAIFDAAFDAVGRPRAIFVCPGFAAGGFAYVQPILDWDNGHLTFKRASAAHYWGGGVGVSGLDMGRYNNSTAIANWNLADKEALYTTSNQTTAINAVKDKFFAASRAVIDDTIAIIPTYRQQLADYCKSKGLAKDAITLLEYEENWHVVFGGTGAWPDQAANYSDRNTDGSSAVAYVANDLRKYTAAAWSSATAYTAGNVVKSGTTLYRCILAHTNQAPPNGTYWVSIGTSVDDGIYKCILAHSNQPCSNATYWTRIATGAIAAESPNRMTLLFQSIMLDSRFGDDLTYYQQQLKKFCGNEQFFYNRLGGITPNGTWTIMAGEDDNDVSGGGSTNWRYKALKDFKATL